MLLAGDQPDDIEDQIRTMCMDFISNPNAVILAVTAGNQVNMSPYILALRSLPPVCCAIAHRTSRTVMDCSWR